LGIIAVIMVLAVPWYTVDTRLDPRTEAWLTPPANPEDTLWLKELALPDTRPDRNDLCVNNPGPGGLNKACLAWIEANAQAVAKILPSSQELNNYQRVLDAARVDVTPYGNTLGNIVTGARMQIASQLVAAGGISQETLAHSMTRVRYHASLSRSNLEWMIWHGVLSIYIGALPIVSDIQGLNPTSPITPIYSTELLASLAPLSKAERGGLSVWQGDFRNSFTSPEWKSSTPQKPHFLLNFMRRSFEHHAQYAELGINEFWVTPYESVPFSVGDIVAGGVDSYAAYIFSRVGEHAYASYAVAVHDNDIRLMVARALFTSDDEREKPPNGWAWSFLPTMICLLPTAANARKRETEHHRMCLNRRPNELTQIN